MSQLNIMKNLVPTHLIFFEPKVSINNMVMNGSVQFNYMFSIYFNVWKYKSGTGFFVAWQQSKSNDGTYRDAIRWNTFKDNEDAKAHKKEIERHIIEEMLKRYPSFANMINSQVKIFNDTPFEPVEGNSKADDPPFISVQSNHNSSNNNGHYDDDIVVSGMGDSKSVIDDPYEDDEDMFARLISQGDD